MDLDLIINITNKYNNVKIIELFCYTVINFSLFYVNRDLFWL